MAGGVKVESSSTPDTGRRVRGVTGRPLLVLLHGTRFDAREWDGYAERIPEADLVCVDLPGHGSRAGEPWTTDGIERAVDDAIVAHVPDSTPLCPGGATGRPVILAGHSLGGYVAARLAAQRPHAYAAVVTIGAAADPTRHPVLLHLYSDFSRVLQLVGPARMAGVANRIMGTLGADATRLPDDTGYAVLPDAWADIAEHAGIHEIAEIDCPVWIVAGAFDQLGIDSRAYAAAARDGHRRLIPRATHLAPITHPEQVAAVLREAVLDVLGTPAK